MNALEALVRSRSYELAFRRGRRHFTGRRSTFRYRGREVTFRVGSTDAGDALEILFSGKRCPYRTAYAIDPGVIWDVGANIGLATLLFKTIYPNAAVCAFEPQSENLELLRHNVEAMPGVTVRGYGLGAASAIVRIATKAPRSVNSFSVLAEPDEFGVAEQAQIRSVADALADNQRPDLLKVDTEGAEYDIFASFPSEVLARVKIIVGELHGHNDAETVALLQQHFEYRALGKASDRRYTHFVAVNRRFTRHV